MRLIDADALIEFCAERWIPLNIDAVNMQPTIQPEKTQLSQEGTPSDLISRTETVEHLRRMLEATVPNTDYDEGFVDGVEFGISTVSTMPTIQPELTDEQAIVHLQSSGWMQRHDKEMYESGLREQLADDSDSYDSLLPNVQSDLIEKIQVGITATNSNNAYSLGMRNGMRWCKSLIDGVEPKYEDNVTRFGDGADSAELPPAQPEPQWIPVSERLPEEYGEYLVTKRTIGWNCEEYDVNDIAYFDDDGFHKADRIIAWMPLPKEYKPNNK